MPAYIRRVRIPVCLLAIIAAIPLVAAESDDQPNIVLVLMDNFGYGEIGVYGGVTSMSKRSVRRHVPR